MTVQNVWNVSKKIKVSKTSQLSRQLTRVIEASVGGREPIIFNIIKFQTGQKVTKEQNKKRTMMKILFQSIVIRQACYHIYHNV